MRLIVAVLSISLFVACEASKKNSHTYHQLSGQTMGTYYKVTTKYPDSSVTSVMVQAIIDGALKEINQAVSTYIDDSDISIINQSKANEAVRVDNEHLAFNLDRSLHWYNATHGYMDISVMPLVNYWGFGYEGKRGVNSIDSAAVDSINRYVRLNKWDFSESGYIKKKYDEQQLDMSALAKGYAVDYIAHILETLGSENYLVDIGGEVKAKGINPSGAVWSLGINTPYIEADVTDYQVAVRLEDKAMASSGNYRNYHKIQDDVYGHTIDPITGYPYQDSLLGVSIITDECIDADAIATACMAMGYAKAATFIANQPEVAACFLVGSADGDLNLKLANGFIRYLVE